MRSSEATWHHIGDPCSIVLQRKNLMVFFFHHVSSACFTDTSVRSNSDKLSCYRRKHVNEKKRQLLTSSILIYFRIQAAVIVSLLYIISKLLIMYFVKIPFAAQSIIFLYKRRMVLSPLVGGGGGGEAPSLAVKRVWKYAFVCIACVRVQTWVKWLCKCPPVVCMRVGAFFFLPVC